MSVYKFLDYEKKNEKKEEGQLTESYRDQLMNSIIQGCTNIHTYTNNTRVWVSHTAMYLSDIGDGEEEECV